MLIIRTDLPAEANAVELLDPIGGHARWLALKVQLVLTTLALDPVKFICDENGRE